MGPLDPSASTVAAILNAAYLVRHYARPIQRGQRAAAVRELGLVLRAAFNSTEDFEPVIAAILDGLRPPDERKPF